MKLDEACNELGGRFGLDPLTVTLSVRVELERANRGGDSHEFDDWVVEDGSEEGSFKLYRATHEMKGRPLRPVRATVRRGVERVVDVEVHCVG